MFVLVSQPFTTCRSLQKVCKLISNHTTKEKENIFLFYPHHPSNWGHHSFKIIKINIEKPKERELAYWYPFNVDQWYPQVIDLTFHTEFIHLSPEDAKDLIDILYNHHFYISPLQWRMQISSLILQIPSSFYLFILFFVLLLIFILLVLEENATSIEPTPYNEANSVAHPVLAKVASQIVSKIIRLKIFIILFLNHKQHSQIKLYLYSFFLFSLPLRKAKYHRRAGFTSTPSHFKWQEISYPKF